MIYETQLKPRRTVFDWHTRFAWRPVRISATHKVWLERYTCRCVCTAEGGWAGGDRYAWEYDNYGRVWRGPEFGS